MKKIFTNLFLFLFLIISLIVILITIGIETNKFNKFISDKASITKNANLELETIKFKLEPKRIEFIFRNRKS